MRISPALSARITAAVTLLVLIGPLATAERVAAAPTVGRIPVPARTTTPDVGGFLKIAPNGFGDPANAYAWSMAWFKGKLYVGTSRDNLCGDRIVYRSAWARRVSGCPSVQSLLSLDLRAQIWAYTPETGAWTRVYQSPMVDDAFNGSVVRLARDVGYRSMAVYTDRHGVTALYVGTTGLIGPAYLLRTVDGVHFATVGPAGLGSRATSIRAMTPYAGRLFIAPFGVNLFYYRGPNRDRVLVSDDPASGHWTAASRLGFGVLANTNLYSMAVFNGQLYAGISNYQGYQVWRTNAQGRPPFRWTAVLVNGAYRGSASLGVTAMAVFHDKLYVGSAAETLGPGGKPAQGCELVAVNPDDSWNLVVGDARHTPEGFKSPLSGLRAGFGSRYSAYLWNLTPHDGWLYAGTYDYSTFALASYPRGARRIAGFDLWKSRDGVRWQEISTTGFGNPYNYGVRTMEDTPAGLFLGTANPFAAAPDHQGGAEVWLLPDREGLARPHGVALNPSACPMAHCDPHISGNETISIPTNGVAVAWRFRQQQVGFSIGLGCAVGIDIAVCAGTNRLLGHDVYGAAYVQALDLQGHALWDSRRLLDAYVAGGVPLLDDQDNSYMSDDHSIISFSPEGVVRWQVPNPAHAVLVSLNMLASGYLVGQAGVGFPNGRGLLLVINPQTGAIAGSVDLTDTVGGYPGDFPTANTVSVVGNRVYTVTQFQPFSRYGSDPLHHGRLYAIDVDASGRPHVAWYWSFEGPTGGSPLTVPGPQTTIYFDGTGLMPGDPQHVMLFAVRDTGASPALLWANDLTVTDRIPYPASSFAPGIQAAPAHDPRGGVWVFAVRDSRLFRFDEATGRPLDELDLAALTGDTRASPDATVDIVANGGKPIMITGVLGGARHLNSVAAIDLAADRLLWTAPVGVGVGGATYGQFPLAPTGDGGALLIAPLFNGVVYGYKLY